MKNPRATKRKRGAAVRYSDLLGGMTAAQVISDPQTLRAYLSQPRAVLFLIRELFERVPGGEQQIQLVDSGIQTLAFLIGDGALKAGKR